MNRRTFRRSGVIEEMTRIDWSDAIVVYGGTAWDGPPMPERQLSIAMSRYLPVLYVDPGRSIASAVKTRSGSVGPRTGLEIVYPNVVCLRTLVSPGVSRPVLRNVAAHTTTKAVDQTVARIGASVRAVLYASLRPGAVRHGAKHRVLYGTDDFAAGASLMGLSASSVAKLERQHLRGSDLVLAVTPDLAQKWSKAHSNVVVFPNGCDVAAFEASGDVPPADDVRLDPPIAGFFGLISDRIDISLLEAVADRGYSLLIVGAASERVPLVGFRQLLQRPNVQWVGPRPFDLMPRYMRAIDVGLIPYVNSAFNRASFPLKTLEYLAAGRSAVSTPLPASRQFGRAVVLADTPQAFADAVGAALRTRSTPELMASRKTVAGEYTWDKRARHLLGLLDWRA